MLIERAATTTERLGLSKIEPPIFYNCPVGIRFEIGVGSPYCYFTKLNKEYVKAALQKAYTIYQNVPGAFDTLLWVIYPDGEKTVQKLLDRFCTITGLPLPQERRLETLPPDDSQDEPVEEVWCYWDLQTHKAKIEKLFEEIIKADIGGLRDLTSSIFLLDTNLNVLFYLYDDRGLDIVVESRDTITPLYKEFGDWILEYDRERIDRTFK